MNFWNKLEWIFKENLKHNYEKFRGTYKRSWDYYVQGIFFFKILGLMAARAKFEPLGLSWIHTPDCTCGS